MSLMEDTQEDLPEVRKAWEPKVITGGKGTPGPPSVDWLSDLPENTTFVALPSSLTVEYNLYHIQHKSLPEVILLIWRLPDGKMLDIYVEPVEFCRKHKKYKILGTQRVANEENEDERNQSGHPDLVLHAPVQGVDQVVSEAEQPDLPD